MYLIVRSFRGWRYAHIAFTKEEADKRVEEESKKEHEVITCINLEGKKYA